MTKKLIALLMALVMCLSLMPTVATATAAEVTETIYWDVKDGTLYLGASETNFPSGTTLKNFNVATSYSSTSEAPWYWSYNSSIEKIEVVDPIAPKNTAYWFYNLKNLKTASLSNLKTDNVENMGHMFQGCKALTTVDGISQWNVASVTNMANMFNACESLTELDLSNWDVSNVTTMARMFDSCYALKTLILSGWNVSQVKDMSRMFTECKKLATITGLPGWKVSNVTTMDNMFSNCKELETIYLSGWDVSNVTTMDKMFNGCIALKSPKLSGWDVSNVTTMANMFNGCTALESPDLSGWKMATATDMTNMFYECAKLESPNLSGWEMATATNMTSMFYRCKEMKEIDATGWKVAKVYQMFSGCKELATITGLPGWDVSCVTDMTEMFNDCDALKSLDLSGWDVSNVTTMGKMFNGCDALESLDLSNWNVSNVKNMANMFAACSALTELDLSGWVTSSVTSMTGTFNNCSGLTELDLSGWVTSSVTNMSGTFMNCSGLTELNLSGWVTASVTNMRGTFMNCSGLTELNLSGWKTDRVTTMESMFSGCSDLETLKLSDKFITSGVTSVKNMFNGCAKLTELDLSDWDLSKVTNDKADNVFTGCSALTTIKTPKNVQKEVNIALPNLTNDAVWSDGTKTFDYLPQQATSTTLQPCHEITVNSITNGSVSVQEYAASGTDVTVTATPNTDDYFVKSVTATTTESQIVPVTASGTNCYTFTMPNKAVTVTAEFAEKSTACTVIFDANGHGNSITMYVASGSNVTNKPTDPTAAGYTFGGWYKETGCTNAWDFANDTVATNTTLYAKWTEKTATLTYNANGHGAAPTNVTMKYATATNAAASLTDVTGYTFTGWNTKADGSGTAYAAGAVVKAVNVEPEDTTLYAQWTANNYAITYKDKDGATFSGTHESGYPTTHTYDTATTLKGATKSGYTFGGWFTDSGCTGTAVTSLGATAYTDNITLYAKWTANSYAITYKDKDGATFSGTHESGYPTTHTYDTATTLKGATKSGYTFGGWFTDSGCTGTAVTSLGATAYTDNITLYAKWTSNSSGRRSGGAVTTVVNMPLIRTGNRGDAVKELQTKLNALGYNCGAVDGIFGSKTYAAVVAFQKTMGIGVDGIVGPETWGKLGVTGITVTTAPAAATSAVSLTISSNMPLITKGSTGDAVKALQVKLNALGYDCGKVDGIFGDKTLAAVKAYQTDKALLVDGMVGSQTWGALR